MFLEPKGLPATLSPGSAGLMQLNYWMNLSALLLSQNKAVPYLQELKSWLEKQRAEVLPKSPMAEGINYTLNHWEALNTYTCDGNLAIENNIAERAVRPFAIGRKTGCSLALIKMESR